MSLVTLSLHSDVRSHWSIQKMKRFRPT